MSAGKINTQTVKVLRQTPFYLRSLLLQNKTVQVYTGVHFNDTLPPVNEDPNNV